MSPSPCNFRSKAPYRAACSTMWSRNGKPVATSTTPLASRSTSAVSRVSFERRSTRPRLPNPDLDRMRMCAQPLHVRHRDARLPEHLEIVPRQRGDAVPFDEVVDAQGRTEPGRAHRGQRVVRAGYVIAQGHRRPGTDEDRAGVLDPSRESLGIAGDD